MGHEIEGGCLDCMLSSPSKDGGTLNLRGIARALGGEVSGHQVLAPGPGHSLRDRSLAVQLSKSAPDGLLVFSHCGDDWRLCREYVGKRLGLARSRPDGAARADHMLSARIPGPNSSTDRDSDADDALRTRRALAIWNGTADPRGTPAWRYLAARGIALDELPSRIHAVLRWHPCCPWGTDGARHGCIVALWTNAISGEPRAIHRTAITVAGAKVGRKTLGPNAGCVIRLWPDEEVECGLVISEGIETALVAATRIQHRRTLLRPAWAIGDAGHLEKFPVLPGIEALTVLVDHDENARGQRAAAECARRWAAAGREVTQLIPRIPGEDFADLVGEPS
jgi:putative DNA primase/helicase